MIIMMIIMLMITMIIHLSLSLSLSLYIYIYIYDPALNERAAPTRSGRVDGQVYQRPCFLRTAIECVNHVLKTT